MSGTGLYTASSTLGTAEIGVEDSLGNTAYVVISISTSTTTGGTTTTTGGTTTTGSGNTITTSSGNSGLVANVVTSYTALGAFQAGCNQTTPWGIYCNSAIKRFCMTQNYGGGGFGPIEHSGDSVTVGCYQSSAATIVATSFSALAGFASNCSAANPMVCASAVNRFCASVGYASGYGVVEDSGDSAWVGCVQSSITYLVNDTFTDLTAQQSACTTANSISDACFSGAYRFCRNYGYTTGFGPLEYSGNTAVWACVR